MRGDGRTVVERDGALDAMRGFAVLGMVVVNLQGSPPDALPFLAHAEWNGLTCADLVFPLFLLVLGLALPLSMDRRAPPPGAARIVRRALLLFVVGLALGWIVRPTLDLSAMRFTGVLERIGIVYLVAALLCRATRGWLATLAIAGALMLLHGILLWSPAPGQVTGSLAPGMGMSGWLDRLVLPGRILRTTWDPEGVLSTLSAIATALIGVGVGRLSVGWGAVRVPLIAAATCAALTLPALLWWPINKALWTPSFVLINAGIGLALLSGLRALWPRAAQHRWARLAERLGQAALTLYVVHTVLLAILVMRVGGERIWTISFDSLAGVTRLPPAWASLLYALVGGALSIAVTLWLRRRGWVLRV